MAPLVLLCCVLGYFLMLLGVAWRTSRRADEASFFIGNRRSPWLLVAFGMVGTSLSGVTFVSVPGTVASHGFTYLQIVLGHVLGYAIVAFVLLPLYYRLGLTSIYRYLGERFGGTAQGTGAWLFLVSRTLGASARLYLVVRVLQDMLLDPLGIPFWLSAAVVVLMILLYTFEGGVRTIVWTDTLQTAGMLTGLVVCVGWLLWTLGQTPLQALVAMQAQGTARVFGTDPLAADFWLKQVLAGVFIAVAMTGLDQEMMQKNISVARLADAQKNMLLMSLVLLAVVALFLFLGGLLAQLAPTLGMPAGGDRLFPAVVLGHLPGWVQLLFVLALVSALFPSADGALTALTASACLDLLRLPERAAMDAAARTRVRKRVHLAFAGLFLLLVLGFRLLDDPSMVLLILKLAGYTYGPLLGLFAFGLLTRRQPRAAWVPVVALAAPALCALLDAMQAQWLGGWRIGLELLLLNAALTFAGLWLASAGPTLNAPRH
ncbi:MAG: sodium:solute symporter [Rubrivivax sp.]|nr:sodium:solute symporter [Rubrivivax sp.]